MENKTVDECLALAIQAEENAKKAKANGDWTAYYAFTQLSASWVEQAEEQERTTLCLK